MLDDGSDLWVWLSAFSWHACALAIPASQVIFRVTVLTSVFSSPCRFQFAARGAIFLTGGFMGVLGALALLTWWIVYLGAVSWTLLGAQLGAYLIFLSGRTHM